MKNQFSNTLCYPYNYGFIPKSRDSNGDALEVFVPYNVDPPHPMSLIEAIPIGVLLTEDEDGDDSKIIAILRIQTDLGKDTTLILLILPL